MQLAFFAPSHYFLVRACDTGQDLSSSRPPATSPITSSPAPTSVPRRAPRTYIRLSKDRDRLYLQTARTTYENEYRKLTIHSLLHIAEAQYYLSLQNLRGTVLFELITSERNVYNEGNLKRLNKDVMSHASARQTARRLNAVSQADALNFCLPKWYLADVSIEKLSKTASSFRAPTNIWLRLVACLLPCPELNLLSLEDFALSLDNIVMLLKAPFSSKRRFVFAWRLLASSGPSGDVMRDNYAWKSVHEVSGDAHLLYGAWHSERFFRRAENEGMTFREQQWSNAMEMPDVCITWRDWAIWGSALAVYAGIAGVDWIHVVDLVGEKQWVEVVLYAQRHLAVYWVASRWLEKW